MGRSRRFSMNGKETVSSYSIIFLHTEVPPALGGHGIGNKLARTALEDAREHKLAVVPLCPFVASYIRHHTEYLSLLTEAERARILRG